MHQMQPETVPSVPAPGVASPSASSLLRILGLGFGLAVVVGGTIGVGILRSPGPVAAYLDSGWALLLAWMLGGLYSLAAANNTAELATMMPRAGGPYVYARRAYGDYGGFVVGWSDWMLNTLALAFMGIVFGEYAASLFPPFAGARVVFAVLVLALIAAINWIGLQVGSQTQKLTSFLKALALLAFIAACFVFGGGQPSPTAAPVVESTPISPLIAGILAFQLVLGAYGGWNAATYFAEEDTDPSRNIPRSLFGGIVLVMTIYVLVNLALLQVLSIKDMAASKFAGADAIRVMFGERGGDIVTALALLSIVGIINALLMFVPRIMLALGRDGLFFRNAARVDPGGTPRFALMATALPAIALAAVGSFETLLAVSEFFAVTIVILLIGALFVLRRREPHAPRPYRAWGYPVVPALMLVFAVGLFIGYIVGNPRNSIYAVMLLTVSYPLYLLIRKMDVAKGNP